MIQPTNAQQLYPAQGGANAVSINIFNPQAYGAAAGNGQTEPYNYTNSLYEMPQSSVYQPQAQAPMVYPGYVQTQNYALPASPAPQPMPESVMTQQPQAQIATADAQPEIAEVKENQNAPLINTDELIAGLKSTDSDTRAAAINKIAEYVQSEPQTALQVVSEPIMNALVNIINEDTSSLEGPSEQQIAVAEKIAKGEQLTPEENALAEQLSPRDKANSNRIFSLYTLAMIQKLQRDELNQYIESQKANGEQPIEPIAINNLIGYNDIVNIIKNDPRPEVKVAGIQALQFIAEPQDKETVASVLADSLNSQNEDIKNAANEAMSKFQA